MRRERLARLFYGPGPVPDVWATDCPVRFDTWLEFVTAPSEPQRRVDLILAINEEHGVFQVLHRLKEIGGSETVAAGSFVAAKLTLPDLVQVVLPMTSLFGVVHRAQDAGQARIRAILEGRIDDSLSGDAHSDLPRRQERSVHLEWFLNLLRGVVAGSHPGESRPEGELTDELINMLLAADSEPPLASQPIAPPNQVIDRRQQHAITSVTTNRQASTAVSKSRSTIKADAAEQLFSVDCSSIGWAIVDSGIDAEHPAFYEWDATAPPPKRGALRVARAFNFVGMRGTLSADLSPNGLIDWRRALPYIEMQLPMSPASAFAPKNMPYTRPADPHGTHIAGILGGWWWPRPETEFRGICPRIRLYDFRVLGKDGKGDEFSIVAALQAIRHINEQAGRFVIAGVNISLSVPHDVAAHSTGWTPVCIECDRLTRSGVVVVTAAGNAGFTEVMRTLGTGYRGISISDPGNADSVLTVGSTHRTNPHRHGVSYFSSRGPTADGRLKPDLLAPGEDIDGPIPDDDVSAMHGTSQAAAHVSGAAAMLLARNRELLGRPERVKEILCETATDLGRERDFQGHGLVDVLRAMQSV